MQQYLCTADWIFTCCTQKGRKLKWPLCGSATTRRPLALCIIISDIWSDAVVVTVIFLERQHLFRSHRSEKWDTEPQKTERTNALDYVVCHVLATLHTLRGATCHEVTYPVKLKEKNGGRGWANKNSGNRLKKKGRQNERANVGNLKKRKLTNMHEECESRSISEPDSNNKRPNNDNLHKDQERDAELEEYSPCPFCWKSFCNKGPAPEQKYSS